MQCIFELNYITEPVDDLSHNTSNARRQLEVGSVRVDSQELAAQLLFYTLLPGLLVRGISVSVVVLINLYCQLQSGQIQINAVIYQRSSGTQRGS